MDEVKTKTVTLSRPIEAHGEKVSELTFTEPDLGALDGVNISIAAGAVKFNMGEMRHIIAAMAGIPPSAAKTIALGDVGEMIEVVLDFLGISLPTGEK